MIGSELLGQRSLGLLLVEAQAQLARSAKVPTLTGGSVQEGLDRVLGAATATADTAEAAIATAGVAGTVAVPATAGTAVAASWTMLCQGKPQR